MQGSLRSKFVLFFTAAITTSAFLSFTFTRALITPHCKGPISKQCFQNSKNNSTSRQMLDQLENPKGKFQTTGNRSRSSPTIRITRDGGAIRLNMTGKFHRTWESAEASDPCSKYLTRFAINLRMVYLVSFPGSGNTWLRYLIEGATGIFTGSVYNDVILYKGGFLGEYSTSFKGSTLTVKTHRWKEWHTQKIPIIFLMRNPAEALIAYFHWTKTRRHINSIPATAFRNEEFHMFVQEKLDSWEELCDHALNGTRGPVYVIYYEKLREDPVRQLNDLLRFLRIPVDESRMDCIAKNLAGNFKRNATEKLQPYNTREKRKISTAVKRVRGLLTSLGYAELPDYPQF